MFLCYPERARGLLLLRERILCFIPGKALGESSGFVEFAGFQSIEIFVGFQLAFSNLQHFHGHIGAMVCGTFAGSQQIFQHEAIFHGAQTVSQSADMAGFDFTDQRVNNLLLGFDLDGLAAVEAAIGCHGAVFDLCLYTKNCQEFQKNLKKFY